MVANSTFLVDKDPPGYSSKLEELDVLIDQLLSEEDRKVFCFPNGTEKAGSDIFAGYGKHDFRFALLIPVCVG